MPHTSSYTKNITYTISNASRTFSRRVSYPNTLSGNQRTVISETIPAYTSGSGINFVFSTGSGAFVAFSSEGAVTVSGFCPSQQNIYLTSANDYVSIFAKTGASAQWESSDGLSLPTGPVTTISIWNSGATPQTLTVESLIDASPSWGTAT